MASQTPPLETVPPQAPAKTHTGAPSAAEIAAKMPTLRRNISLGVVFIPPLGVIGCGILLWNSLLGPLDIAIFVLMYIPTTVAITLGFHRLLTHRSFQTHRWLRYTLAILGSMSVQGSVIHWVADHRKHHTFTDEEGDPHSPHVGHGAGLRGMLRGLWHAHAGWLMRTHGRASMRRYARDLHEDPVMRRIDDSFAQLVLLSLLLPAALGFALSGGSALAALTAFLWAGLMRIFIGHHITWSINSVCHYFGRRRFAVEDESTNVIWLALPSLGEAWHHNHHAFPQSAYHGLRWYELDPTGWMISALEKVGLAWDVVRISPEKQRAKLAASSVQS
jgi:stearoyl-CoA desaturase (delta-9 desaturase)